jgi:uncharacterized protein with FMN-binding domain
MRWTMTKLVGVLLIWFSGCTPGVVLQTTPLPSFGPWNDGTYTGIQELPTPQLLVVEVAIQRGWIVAIHLRQHPEWQAPQEQELLLRQVVERQTTEVYTLRNDGSEQDLLLRAIEDALYKARQGTRDGETLTDTAPQGPVRPRRTAMRKGFLALRAASSPCDTAGLCRGRDHAHQGLPARLRQQPGGFAMSTAVVPEEVPT